MGHKESSATFIERWGAGVMIAIWYASSIIGNNAGKAVLPLFPYPYTLSVMQFGLGAMSIPLSYFLTGRPTQHILSMPRTFFKRGLFLGVTGICSNLFHRVALMFISVSFSHTIKATQPLFSAILSYVLLGHRFSLRTVVALLVVVLGVGMSALTEFDFNLLGFVAATLSAFSMSVANTVQKSFMGKSNQSSLPVTSEAGQPQVSSFDQNELFFLTNFFSVLMMLPFWWLIDGKRMWAATNPDWETYYVSLMVLGNTAPNVVQHFSSLTILNLLSPVSHSLANSCKRVLVIAISVVVFRNPVSLLNFIGMACALIGVFAYQQSLSAEKRDKAENNKPSIYEHADEVEKEALLYESQRHTASIEMASTLTPGGSAKGVLQSRNTSQKFPMENLGE